MHREILSNTQIHPATGGKSALHKEMYKCETALPESATISEKSYYNATSPSKIYNDGIGTTGGKSIVKGKPPDNPLSLENLRKGHTLASSKLPFLWKLHEMLDDVEKTGDQHIVSWFEHGCSFRVHKPKSFVQKIIPYYFNQSKYKSFQRQLHLYEFTRIPRGPEAGAYCHPKFIRGMKSICMSLSPKKIKGKVLKKEMMQCRHGDTTCIRGSTPGEDKILPSYQSIAFSADETATSGANGGQPGNCMAGETSQWMAKLRKILVTGASLAAQLEKKSRCDAFSTVPHQGDMVYVFGGMPFRYIDSKANMEELGDISDSISECDESIIAL